MKSVVVTVTFGPYPWGGHWSKNDLTVELPIERSLTRSHQAKQMSYSGQQQISQCITTCHTRKKDKCKSSEILYSHHLEQTALVGVMYTLTENSTCCKELIF
ncbi:hypothetical protein CRENBAI_008038 [Crenichthys baileyi]|uniref:Uncharacterized protein n=1 Tax=Crenichthys baileyi TaxID=28760 RepID=A0AAV9QTR8_9TELE